MSNRKGSGKAPWEGLSVADFRAFVDRIDDPKAAEALLSVISADVQHIADELLYAEETDAARHKDKFWRRRALVAKKYLDRKREILVSRILALHGTVPEAVLQEIEATARAARKARHSADPNDVLRHLRAIIADLAAGDVLVEDENGLSCLFCERQMGPGEPLGDHDEDCPWRRAVEEVERFPVRELEPEEAKARIAEEVRDERAKTSALKKKVQVLERKLKRQLEHTAHMETEKKKIRSALRKAVKRLVEIGDEKGMTSVGEVEPGFLSPEFYNLEPRKKPQ